MEVAVQILGSLGLAETVVDFLYVVTSADKFTDFETLFLWTQGSLELLGQIAFILMALGTPCSNSACCRLLLDGKPTCDWLGPITKDPIHNLAQRHPVHGLGNYAAAAMAAMLLSLVSVVCWASFILVWGPWFDEYEGVRMALSVCSTALIVMAFLLPCVRGRDRIDQSIHTVLFAMYTMEKSFEVYILVANFNRLCDGSLGKALVVLLFIEVLSAAVVTWRSAVGDLGG